MLYLYAQPSILEKVVVFGNRHTKDHVILRELEAKEGESFSDQMLLEDRVWLLRQDFLKRIEFLIKSGSLENSHMLIILVQEKGTWSASPILSNKDIFGWYAGTRLTTHNLWGRRNRIDATFQFGGIQHFGLSYMNPWLAGRLQLFTELDLYHTSFRYAFNDYGNHFDERDLGAAITLGRRFGRRLQLGVRMGIENIWVGNSKVTLSDNHEDDLSRLGACVRFDSRDWPLYPKIGIYLQSWTDWYSQSREYPFRRTGIDFRWYAPVYNDNILAFQTYIELSHGNVPVYKRLHLGGGKTIRGYDEGALAGESTFLASLEYRFPILYERNPLAGIHVGYAGVLFVDVASAWFQYQSLKPDMFRGAVGFGIHVIWDHWVLRAEYGNRGMGWGFINFGTGVKF